MIPAFWFLAVEKFFEEYSNAGAMCTGFSHVDENGNFLYPNENISDKEGVLEDWLSILATGQKIQLPSVVVKRSAQYLN